MPMYVEGSERRNARILLEPHENELGSRAGVNLLHKIGEEEVVCAYYAILTFVCVHVAHITVSFLLFR